uniref:Uncharacterized protein n=1 Tax=Rhynchobrunnera orthospora TaxID=210010 RepID=V5W5P0_9HELO|nr:hypothetical protein [Rhynchobrunnera orthospora]AHC02384.1 hypothetical protein [Rhynchobrunnera orthospora]
MSHNFKCIQFIQGIPRQFSTTFNKNVTGIIILLQQTLCIPTSLYIYSLSNNPYSFLLLNISLLSSLLLSYLIVKPVKNIGIFRLIRIIYNKCIKLPCNEIIGYVLSYLCFFILTICVSNLLTTVFLNTIDVNIDMLNSYYFLLYLRSIILFPTLYITYIIQQLHKRFRGTDKFIYTSMGINNLNYGIYSLFFMSISIYLGDTYLKPYVNAKISAYQLNKLIDTEYSTKFINIIDMDKLNNFIYVKFKHTSIQTIIFELNNKKVHVIYQAYYEKFGVTFESIPEKKTLLNRFYITVVGNNHYHSFDNYSKQFLYNTPGSLIRDFERLSVPLKPINNVYLNDKSIAINIFREVYILSVKKGIYENSVKGLCLHKKFFKPSINILYNINRHESVVQEIINNFTRIDVTQEIINNFNRMDVTSEINKMDVELSISNLINKAVDPLINYNDNMIEMMRDYTPGSIESLRNTIVYIYSEDNNPMSILDPWDPIADYEFTIANREVESYYADNENLTENSEVVPNIADNENLNENMGLNIEPASLNTDIVPNILDNSDLDFILGNLMDFDESNLDKGLDKGKGVDRALHPNHPSFQGANSGDFVSDAESGVERANVLPYINENIDKGLDKGKGVDRALHPDHPSFQGANSGDFVSDAESGVERANVLPYINENPCYVENTGDFSNDKEYLTLSRAVKTIDGLEYTTASSEMKRQNGVVHGTYQIYYKDSNGNRIERINDETIYDNRRRKIFYTLDTSDISNIETRYSSLKEAVGSIEGLSYFIAVKEMQIHKCVLYNAYVIYTKDYHGNSIGRI